MNALERAFVRKRQSRHSGARPSAGPLVVVQGVEDYYYLALFASLADEIRARFDARVELALTGSLRPNMFGGVLAAGYGLAYTNWLTNLKWRRLYESFCDGVAYQTSAVPLGPQWWRSLVRAQRLWNRLRTRDDVLRLTIDELPVGDLVYDTYLRFRPAATVRPRDPYLLVILLQTCRDIERVRRYFQRARPHLVLLTYSTYIQHGITARVALTEGSRVFTFANYQEIAKQLTASDPMHTRNTKHYRGAFAHLPDQAGKLARAEAALKQRFAGRVDMSTAYMKRSAYDGGRMDLPDLRGHLVVFLHDFFDSPHCYGEMTFADFNEWIEFTFEHAARRGLKICVKQHPNEVGDSKKIVADLRRRFPDVPFLDPKVSNVQLAESGIVGAVTVYGTIAHEMAYFGLPTISCGDNPHLGYAFCHNASTREQYASLLEAIPSLPHDRAKYRRHALEFYYMHNLNRPETDAALQSKLLDLRSQTLAPRLLVDLDALIEPIERSSAFSELVGALMGVPVNDAATAMALPRVATAEQ
jgi:hypothetical protein